MISSSYLNLVWTDEGLIWEPNEEGNITVIRIPIEKIWIPDIFVYNGADRSSWNPWGTNS